MSVEAISAVLNLSKTKGSTRGVAVALANRADEHGLCWPSVADLSKRANCSPRTVQYALRRMEQIGELRVLSGDTGGRKLTPLYHLDLPGLDGEVTPEHPYFANKKGAKLAPPERAQPETGKGASSDSERAQTSAPEPSIEEPSENQNKQQGEVEQLFGLWQQETNRPNAKLTDGRRRALEARLRDYPAELIARAIRNVARSPFHQGKNDTGRRHDDLTLICRNGEKLEGYAELAVPDAPKAPPPVDLELIRGGLDEAQAAWDGAVERLREAVPDSTFELWLAPLRPVGIDDRTLYIAAPIGTLSWTEKRYAVLIREALRATGAEFEVAFVPDDADEAAA